MKFVQQLFLYISITSLIFFLIGLYKPWIMLWWEDKQNRRKVFRIYGVIAFVGFGVYLILKFLFNREE